MIDFKITAIVVIVVSLLSGGLAYKYQQNHYENLVAQQQAERLIEVTNLTTKVLDTERKNNEITNQLNKKSASQTSTITGLRSQLASLRNSSGSLLVTANCSEATSSVANSTSSSDPTSTSRVAAGLCQLPTMFSEFLIKVTYDADVLRNTALLCKEYSEAIEQQRKDIINDKQ